MAFMICDKIQKVSEIKCDGVYVIPLDWMLVGLKIGMLSIETPQFFTKVQGSAFSIAQSKFIANEQGQISITTSSGEKKFIPVWLIADPKDGEKGKIHLVDISNHPKIILHDGRSFNVNSIEEIREMNPLYQQANNLLCKGLMKGTFLKLNFPVWFYDVLNN